MLGRHIGPEVIDCLQSQAADCSRRQLAAVLCRDLQWVGPGGKWQISVAMDALAQLSRRGALNLPPARPRPGVLSTALPAQGPAAVEVPAVECALAQVQPIELVVVSNRRSREYGIWRQLLREHHYLGAGPLCGHQLRYLIKGACGWLGAAAFSAAARRVADREKWIGWSEEARRENLPLVISNSRFLILPQVRIANLASHVLARLSQCVAQDWQERFGYRPELLESFVELGRFRGTCYQAANWKLVGVSCGRGRQDRAHAQGVAKKLLYVYPLRDDFRARLCQLREKRRLAPPTPAAPPEPPRAPQSWMEAEFGAVALPDERLKRRLQSLAADFFARPGMNLPQACGSRAKAKAAYRFFDHKAVNLNTLLAGHYQATRLRAAKERVILAVQDTTELNYSAHPATEMLGPLTDKPRVVGLLLHETIAYNLEGTPLGLLDTQCWARDPDEPGKRKQRYELPIAAKESSKWLVSHAAASRLQEQCPGNLIVSVGDREADIYELFVQAQQRPQAAKVLVRARQTRQLAEAAPGQSDLWQSVQQSPKAGDIELSVPRQKNRPARLARLEVRFLEVTLQAPKRKPELGEVRCWAICAREITVPPPGVEPVEWLLLTNLPVLTFAEALEKIQWYALRFQIEVYHRVLKSGCKIEQRQLGNAERIEACLAIDLVVAWRIAHLTKLGREVPDLPCTVYFEEAQWQALLIYATKQLPPAKPPSLRELVRLIAMRLGGFLGRKSDGEPGATVIWRGLQRLDDITQMYCAVRGLLWVPPTLRELDSG